MNYLQRLGHIAPEAYNAIRYNNDDVVKIARNTEWAEFRIQRIKDPNPDIIDRELTLTFDIKHLAKHLPNTSQMQHLLQKEGSAHIFIDEVTIYIVAQAIIEKGEFTGCIRGHERCGICCDEPIGYRVSRDGDKFPLYYAEMKVKGNKYHVIPRTKPGR